MNIPAVVLPFQTDDVKRELWYKDLKIVYTALKYLSTRLVRSITWSSHHNVFTINKVHGISFAPKIIFFLFIKRNTSSISDYVATLRIEFEFISSCKYAVSIVDNFLRAQFFRGFNNNSIRGQLLHETLTFLEIFSKSLSLEAQKLLVENF